MTNESTNKQSKNKFDIKERAFDFAARTALFVKALPKNSIVFQYTNQLIRSSASVGANLEEADGTLSRKDFINKIGISRREARESRYWLRLITKIEQINDINLRNEAAWLQREAGELLLILSSIIQKTREKQIVS